MINIRFRSKFEREEFSKWYCALDSEHRRLAEKMIRLIHLGTRKSWSDCAMLIHYLMNQDMVGEQ